jgi:hypothetical protein
MTEQAEGCDGQQEAGLGEPAETELYGRLAAPFDVTFRDLRGGVELEYITGEQATTRLNETLGFLNWSFRVLEHGIHAEADECWVLGELAVTLDGRTVTRQQFGSQKVKRSRSAGTPLDVGFDLKGAATDALKKCASLVGVALYLWKKTPPAGHSSGGPPADGPINPAVVTNDAGEPICQQDVGGALCGDPLRGWEAGNGHPARDAWWVANWQLHRQEYGIPLCLTHQTAVKRGELQPRSWQPAAPGTDPDALSCEECGEELTESRFKDGTTWAPAQLAVFGQRKHSRILCMGHYREANQAKRRAEEALQQVPF